MLDAYGTHDFTFEHLARSISSLYRDRWHARISPTRAAISDGRQDLKNSPRVRIDSEEDAGEKYSRLQSSIS